MKPGKVVLFPFPFSDQIQRKLRPALLLKKPPGAYEDWLVVMISSNINRAVENFDEIVSLEDNDFQSSGLKTTSVICLGRLAVMNPKLMVGSIGSISSERLQKIYGKIAEWLIA